MVAESIINEEITLGFPKLVSQGFHHPLTFGCFGLLALSKIGSMDTILALGASRFVHFYPAPLTSRTLLCLMVLLLPLPLAMPPPLYTLLQIMICIFALLQSL